MTHFVQGHNMLRHAAMLDGNTMLEMLLRNEMSADEFQVNFAKLSSSERMQLLERLEASTRPTVRRA